MAIAAAFPGTKIVFRDDCGDGEDLIFDIVLWREKEDDTDKVMGYVVLPGWNTLCPVEAIPVPPCYNIVGIAKCAE